MVVRVYYDEVMEYSHNFRVKENNDGETVYILLTDTGKTLICPENTCKIMHKITTNNTGQDIYEYDVVDFNANGQAYTGLVIYSKTRFCYGIRTYDKLFPIEYAIDGIIIGNIFEFPFLLELCQSSGAPEEYTIYTDGSCLNNPGTGGYGVVILKGDKKVVAFSGAEENTTNNRQELLAAIKGLKEIKGHPDKITLISDSKYLVDAFEKGWIDNWKMNGWKNSKGEQLPNMDLWKQLIDLTDKQNVKFSWVKGHNGNQYNEECDRLALKAAMSLKGETVKYE